MAPRRHFISLVRRLRRMMRNRLVFNMLPWVRSEPHLAFAASDHWSASPALAEPGLIAFLIRTRLGFRHAGLHLILLTFRHLSRASGGFRQCR
jgi:hypothetical protein